MVSLDVEAFRSYNDAFLIVKLDSDEFATSVEEIDMIGEFKELFQRNLKLKFGLGSYCIQNRVIPVINLKKYLGCTKTTFIPTSQSRILFLSDLNGKSSNFEKITIGISIDAVIGLYKEISSKKKVASNSYFSSELKCFQICSYIKTNSKIYPILDLKQFLDYSLLKSLLIHYTPEKI